MIHLIFGTRPEIIKILPLIPHLKAANIPFKLIYITQHTDLIPDLPEHVTITLGDISTNRLNNVVLNILDQENDILEGCTHVLVQGDTVTAYATALAAFTRNIPILYLESGMRSWDIENPYPEEALRRMISSIASYHFCATKQNCFNIRSEGIRKPIYMVGNTVLDTIDPTPIPQENKVLITMHRRENLPILDQWFIQIDKLTRWYPQYEFIFPMHPNPEIQKFKHLIPKVKIIKPLSREDLIIEIKKSILIISDSGGIQEEACFLKRKIIVARRCTERQEALWLNASLCKTPEFLPVSFRRMLNKKLDDYICPFGSGDSSIKIVEILKKELKDDKLNSSK